MFHKIQKYLLLHHPLIWNIRLVPMALILLLMNILIGITGYRATHVIFKYTHDNYIKNIESFYPVCILISVILLIGWLVIYNRNNAFKTFYPRKPRQVYFEWLLIFSITTGIAVLPVSLTLGCILRWQSVVSENETKETLSYLKQIKMLLPSQKLASNYKYSEGSDYIEITDSIFDKYASWLSDEQLNYFGYNIYPKKDPLALKRYLGPSLLYYSYEDDFIRIGLDLYQNEKGKFVKHTQIKDFIPQTHKAIEDVLLVKQWLREGQKDSLLNLMDKLQLLHEKHGLHYSLDKEKWFEWIYHPPCFLYEPYEKTNFWHKDMRYHDLLGTYNEIDNFYNTWDHLSGILLICLCVALWGSAFIFSFRVTNGKAWLIALITSGTLFFITCVIIILTQHNDSDILIQFILLLAWIISFICMQVTIYKKAKTNNTKGKSFMFMNIYLWLLPCLIPLFFIEYEYFYDLSDRHYRAYSQEDIQYMFWINLAVNIIIMYPVARLVRKWKNTPDE